MCCSLRVAGKSSLLVALGGSPRRRVGVEGPPGGGEGEARGQVGHCAVQKDSGNLGTVAEDKNFIGGGFPLRN